MHCSTEPATYNSAHLIEAFEQSQLDSWFISAKLKVSSTLEEPSFILKGVCLFLIWLKWVQSWRGISLRSSLFFLQSKLDLLLEFSRVLLVWPISSKSYDFKVCSCEEPSSPQTGTRNYGMPSRMNRHTDNCAIIWRPDFLVVFISSLFFLMYSQAVANLFHFSWRNSILFFTNFGHRDSDAIKVIFYSFLHRIIENSARVMIVENCNSKNCGFQNYSKITFGIRV